MSGRRSISAWCVGLLVATGVWVLLRRPASPVVPPDVGGTYSGVTAGTGDANVRYPYHASADRERQVRGGFGQLRLGQSRGDVRRLLGPPDEADALSGKPLRYRGWQYAYLVDARWPNDNDSAVAEVSFDRDGHLDWAGARHLDGLVEIRRPTPR